MVDLSCDEKNESLHQRKIWRELGERSSRYLCPIQHVSYSRRKIANNVFASYCYSLLQHLRPVNSKWTAERNRFFIYRDQYYSQSRVSAASPSTKRKSAPSLVAKPPIFCIPITSYIFYISLISTKYPRMRIIGHSPFFPNNMFLSPFQCASFLSQPKTKSVMYILLLLSGRRWCCCLRLDNCLSPLQCRCNFLKMMMMRVE